MTSHRIVTNQFSFIKSQWYAVALSSELKRRHSIRRTMHGCPILVWRSSDGNASAIVDACLHQRAQVDVVDFDKNRIVCPYHGWEYNQDGKLVNVPSDSQACSRLGNASLSKFIVSESCGFIWIWVGDAAPDSVPNIDIANEGKAWHQASLVREFETTEQLLIDNFMDPTHTGTVHRGIIRSADQAQEHRVTLSSSDRGVAVDFEESTESVAVGLSWILGKSIRVRHRDEFLLPNIVRVTYWFNDEPRFVALIACNSVEDETHQQSQHRTRALVQLRYRFGMFNPLIGLGLRVIAPKVLAQDFAITQQQYRNRKRLPHQQDKRVAADAVSVRVGQLRSQADSGTRIDGTKSQSLTLRF